MRLLYFVSYLRALNDKIYSFKQCRNPMRQGQLLFSYLNLAMQPNCILRQNKNSVIF
jgi:hypothetical protein